MFNTAGVSVGLAGFASSGAGVSAVSASGVGVTVGVSVGVAVGVGVSGGGVRGASVAVAAGLGETSAVGEPVDSGGFVDGTPIVGEAGVSGLTVGIAVSVTRPAMGVGPPHALSRRSAQTARGATHSK